MTFSRVDMRNVRGKRKGRQNADDHEKSLSKKEMNILHERVLSRSLICLNSTNGSGLSTKGSSTNSSARPTATIFLVYFSNGYPILNSSSRGGALGAAM
jgi:hypothetical protein